MAGHASPLGLDDDENAPILDLLRPKRQERVEALRDSSLQAVDLDDELVKEAQEAPPRPQEAPPQPRQAQEASQDLPDAPEAPAGPPAPLPAPRLDEPPEPTVPPEVLARGRILSTARARASELDALLIDAYGTAWLEWLPETLWETIHKDFGVPIAAQNRDTIMAAKLLHVSDSFWRSWEVFEKVVVAFNGGVPLFDRVQDPSLAQIGFAMREAATMRKEEYQDEILGYIAARAKEEGLTLLIPPMDVAQDRLDEIVPPEIVPLRKELGERWSAFEGVDLDGVELKEDFFGIQIARLAGVQKYMETAARAVEEEE